MRSIATHPDPLIVGAEPLPAGSGKSANLRTSALENCRRPTTVLKSPSANLPEVGIGPGGVTDSAGLSANLQEVETGTAAVPVSRRSFLGSLIGLAGGALALGAAAGTAGPLVAATAVPAPVAPLGVPLRAYLTYVCMILDQGSDLVDRQGFVAMWNEETGRIIFVTTQDGRSQAFEALGWVPIADDAADRIRAMLAADAKGGLDG